MPNRLHCYLFAVVLLLCACFAHASNTTLTGTITDAQGNPLNGTLYMRLPVPAQDTTLNVAVSTAPVIFNLVNGVITSSSNSTLKDVTTLQPSGLYYIARAYDLTGALQFYGNFIVTGTTFNLGQATPTSVTTSNVSYVLPILPSSTNNFTAPQQFVTILDGANSPDASTGFMRMAQGDQLCWRNVTNLADICLGYSPVSGIDSIFVTNSLVVNGGNIFAPANTGLTIDTVSASGSPGPTLAMIAASGGSAGQAGGNVNIQPGLGVGGGADGTTNITVGLCSAAASTGCQQKRVASCATAASAGATCNTTFTWNATFRSVNYTAVCTVDSPTGVPYVINTSGKTATQMTVTIAALTAVAASGTLNCIGLHD